MSETYYVVSCPKCGCSTLEEVMINVVVSTTFREVLVETDRKGVVDICEPSYLNASNDAGEVVRYQCLRCGWVMPGASDSNDLAEWVLKNARVKGDLRNVATIVHFMKYGQTACVKPGVPKDWPDNEFWDRGWENVNCPDCLKSRPKDDAEKTEQTKQDGG